MAKLGDRFTWHGTPFDTLACDMDVMDEGDGWGYASHVDDAGMMQQLFAQDVTTVENLNRSSQGVQQYVITRWQAPTAQRGLLDMNYAHGDGSVSRITGIRDHTVAHH